MPRRSRSRRSWRAEHLRWAARATIAYVVEAVLVWVEDGDAAPRRRFVAATNAALRAGVRSWAKVARAERTRMKNDAAIIEVGLNEAVSPATQPHVPQRPSECAADARRCADAVARSCTGTPSTRRARSSWPTPSCTARRSTRSTAGCSRYPSYPIDVPDTVDDATRPLPRPARTPRPGARAHRCRDGQYRAVGPDDGDRSRRSSRLRASTSSATRCRSSSTPLRATAR